MDTTYTTKVNDREVYSGSELEAAIRAWDANTFQDGEAVGGVAVQSFAGGVMVRDGWILHVRENGVVYLNPGVGAT